MNRILLLSSHPDDIELAAGATVKRIIDEGHQVRHIVFSDCDNKESITEFALSQQVLGITDYHAYPTPFRRFGEHRQIILDALIKHKRDLQPTHVITHGSRDTNQDHQILHSESFRAFKTCNLLGYNHPWNYRESTVDFFVRIEQQHLDAKLKALTQYSSQQHRPYFKPAYIEGKALSYGTMLQCGLAEGFETLNYTY